MKTADMTELKEHKDRVRSLVWNIEMPWLLISAADDSKVVLWNIQTKQAVTSVIESTLAMTSLIAHPERPF